jgi:hypothetical protein
MTFQAESVRAAIDHLKITGRLEIYQQALVMLNAAALLTIDPASAMPPQP